MPTYCHTDRTGDTVENQSRNFIDCVIANQSRETSLRQEDKQPDWAA